MSPTKSKTFLGLWTSFYDVSIDTQYRQQWIEDCVTGSC
jgi:hypothetical protein